jgi:acetyl-CoA carboxylase carboxyltransferase component
MPAETRQYIRRALIWLRGKQKNQPAGKHGNIPL